MKKFIATFITLVILSMAALPVAAQTRGRRSNRSFDNGRTVTRYDSRYRNDAYRNGVNRNDAYDPYYDDDDSFWDEHRDKITTAAGAGGGAVLGGLIGGKKGAIIGAITGGVGAAIYTYKIRDKNNRY